MHSKFSHRFSCIWAIYERSVNTACASWALTNRHHCAVHPTNLLRKYNMLQLCTTQATLLGKISPTGLTKFKEISRDCRHSELVLCHNNIRQKQKTKCGQQLHWHWAVEDQCQKVAKTHDFGHFQQTCFTLTNDVSYKVIRILIIR